MRRIADIALVVVLAMCAETLLEAASIGPFRHANVFVSLLTLGLALALFAGAGIAILIPILRGPPGARRQAWLRAAIAGAIVVSTAGLVVTGAPRQIAFALSRDAFDELLASLPVAISARQQPLDRRVGLFVVDRYGVDADGGVYLRVDSSSLLETTSWGFCVKPHATTSPFGAAGYETTSLGGRWYWFEANDDWY